MTGSTQPCSYTCSCTDCSDSCPPIPPPPPDNSPKIYIFGIALSALAFGTILGGLIFSLLLTLLAIVMMCTKPDYDEEERRRLMQKLEEEQLRTREAMLTTKSILGFLNNVNRKYVSL